MKELFVTMFLLDNYTKPENATEVALYIVLYLIWIPIVILITLFYIPIWLLLTPFRLLHQKIEEDAIIEYTGKW